MPSRLLTINMNSLSAVDDRNVDNVFKIWRIFAISGDSLENGRRFENLSWRLWNKEALCNAEEQPTQQAAVVEEPSVPEDKEEDSPYSSSVESLPSPLEAPQGIAIRPTLSRRQSSDRKEKQPSPAQLARLMDKVASQDPDVRSWVRSASPSLEYKHVVTDIDPASLSSSNSTCSTDSSMESEGARVIRGFSLGKTSTVGTSMSSTASFRLEKPKSKGMFMVGPESYGSSSDSYERPSLIAHFRKQTSFNEEVTTRQYDASDDDVLSESAIEEEDESDWDSVTDSAGSSYDNRQMFTRVPEARLPTRRSLLSTLLTEPTKTRSLNHHRREGPSLPQSPRDGLSRARPIAIDTPSALSPRTTRKHMIATELTESLRRNLLWERQQKTKTTAAVLKRRHTAQDFAVMYPKVDEQIPYRDDSRNISWNSYNYQAFLDYNATGW